MTEDAHGVVTTSHRIRIQYIDGERFCERWITLHFNTMRSGWGGYIGVL